MVRFLSVLYSVRHQRADLSSEDVVYHDVDSYQSLMNIMESL